MTTQLQSLLLLLLLLLFYGMYVWVKRRPHTQNVEWGFLHLGSFPIPIIHKCILKVLCPVSRPITTLVWVLLRDNSRAAVAGSGPEFNSRIPLCVLQVSVPSSKVKNPVRYSGSLRSELWQFITDSSGQTVPSSMIKTPVFSSGSLRSELWEFRADSSDQPVAILDPLKWDRRVAPKRR